MTGTMVVLSRDCGKNPGERQTKKHKKKQYRQSIIGKPE